MINAVIFDMDNTLLQSRIDFVKMRKVVYDLLHEHGILASDFEWAHLTPSQIIESGRPHPKFAGIEQALWKRIEEVEAEGMEGVTLEPYAEELLHDLQQRNIRLLILRATEQALENLDILNMFDDVVCREQMKELKPSPSGIEYIFSKYPSLVPKNSLVVGDSWIDGMAATMAKVPFVTYKGDIAALRQKGIECIARIDRLDQLLQWIHR